MKWLLIDANTHYPDTLLKTHKHTKSKEHERILHKSSLSDIEMRNQRTQSPYYSYIYIYSFLHCTFTFYFDEMKNE